MKILLQPRSVSGNQAGVIFTLGDEKVAACASVAQQHTRTCLLEDLIECGSFMQGGTIRVYCALYHLYNL